MKRKLILGLLVFLGTANVVFSAPLNVVTVNAPAVNCVFNTSCTITVSDTTATIPIAATGTNFLQSRSFTGSPGAPANGFNGYMYRVDLTNAVSSMTPPPCVSSVAIPFGPVAAFDYNGDGVATDQVFVVTSGGLGSVALASADQDASGKITFTFSSPVCPGTGGTAGQTSYFFGLASQRSPVPVSADVTEAGGAVHSINARAPDMTMACGIPPYAPAFWNDSGTVQYNNNCYNYGNNKRTDTYAQPGRYAGIQNWTMQCPNVTAAATADGLVPTTANATCPGGMDKVALVMDPGVDYHWYRLGNDGMWSHKPGGGAATNLDGSGNTISNPETANRCGGWPCYSVFCGYFCTCSDVQQGQGHATIN